MVLRSMRVGAGMRYQLEFDARLRPASLSVCAVLLVGAAGISAIDYRLSCVLHVYVRYQRRVLRHVVSTLWPTLRLYVHEKNAVSTRQAPETFVAYSIISLRAACVRWEVSALCASRTHQKLWLRLFLIRFLSDSASFTFRKWSLHLRSPP